MTAGKGEPAEVAKAIERLQSDIDAMWHWKDIGWPA